MKNINNFTQWKKWISRCDVRARDHAPKAPRAVWAQYAYLLESQSENKKLSWSVWMPIIILSF